MIAKLEGILWTALQNKDPSQNPKTQWDSLENPKQVESKLYLLKTW